MSIELGREQRCHLLAQEPVAERERLGRQRVEVVGGAEAGALRDTGPFGDARRARLDPPSSNN